MFKTLCLKLYNQLVLAYGDSTFYPQNILFEEIFDNPRNFIIKSFMRCTYIWTIVLSVWHCVHWLYVSIVLRYYALLSSSRYCCIYNCTSSNT